MIHIYRRVYKKCTEKPSEETTTPRQFPTMAMTVEEMSDELRLSRPIAYELVKEEGFPSLRIGKRILVNRAALQEWLNQQSSVPLVET